MPRRFRHQWLQPERSSVSWGYAARSVSLQVISGNLQTLLWTCPKLESVQTTSWETVWASHVMASPNVMQPLESVSPVILNPHLNPKKPVPIELLNKVGALQGCVLCSTDALHLWPCVAFFFPTVENGAKLCAVSHRDASLDEYCPLPPSAEKGAKWRCSSRAS